MLPALIYAVSVAIYAVSSLVIMVLRRDQGLLYRAATLVLGSLAGATVVRALLALGVMGEVSSMPGLPALTFYVGCIMVAIQVLQYVAPKFGPAGIAPHPIPAPRTDAGPGPAEPAAAPPRARLADRLGLAEGAHVLKVTADGHFIEVKTCSGTVRTRLRFSDALAELDGQSGIVTHRSHWVALMAIRGWMPHAAKPVIVLQDDTCVPISKTYKEAVAALGLPEVSLDASAGARAED